MSNTWLKRVWNNHLIVAFDRDSQVHYADFDCISLIFQGMSWSISHFNAVPTSYLGGVGHMAGMSPIFYSFHLTYVCYVHTMIFL
jgi:hypothetical protein